MSIMGNIKENLLNEYSIREYLLALLGVLFLAYVSRELWFIRMEEMDWDTIFKIIVMTSFGALLQFYPLAVTDFVKNKFGIQSKTEK